MLEGVRTGLGVPFLAWSPAGRLIYMQGSNTGEVYEIVRVGRDGSQTPIDTAWHGGFNSIALSPDGRRLAVGVGLASGALGIWIKQLDRGPFSRLTFGGQDRRPAWSPDGRDVAFIRDSLTGIHVYARVADGSAPDRLLARLDRQVQEVTWSPDGRWLVLRTDNSAPGAGDLVGVRTTGDTTPVPLVASPFQELHPAVSPDSRWLAYTSNESGANEVYVRSFPGTTGGRWQVSNGGGIAAALVARRPRAVLPGQQGPADRGHDRRVQDGAGRGRAPAAVRRVRLRDRPLPYRVRGDGGRARLPLLAAAAAGPGVGAGAGSRGGELVRRCAAEDGAVEGTPSSPSGACGCGRSPPPAIRCSASPFRVCRPSRSSTRSR